MADRSEFAAYVAARQGQLLRYAYSLCGDWPAAEDVVQVSLEKLYVAWPRVVRGGQVDAYVRRIVAHAAIDAARKPWRREITAGESLLAGEQPEVTNTGPTPEVIAALLQLPAMQRRVVVLRHLLDLSVGQVADELNISPGSVKSHNARGLTRLNQLLTEQRPQEMQR